MTPFARHRPDRLKAVHVILTALLLADCGGGGNGGAGPPPAAFTIGGTVAGLSGQGLLLRDSNGDSVSVAASGSFTFPLALQSGAS